MSETKEISLDGETQQRLAALGAALDRSPRELAHKALSDYLNREERIERERAEDEDRWQEYLRTGHAIPHERVTKWLDDLANGRPAECPQ